MPLSGPRASSHVEGRASQHPVVGAGAAGAVSSGGGGGGALWASHFL